MVAATLCIQVKRRRCWLTFLMPRLPPLLPAGGSAAAAGLCCAVGRGWQQRVLAGVPAAASRAGAPGGLRPAVLRCGNSQVGAACWMCTDLVLCKVVWLPADGSRIYFAAQTHQASWNPSLDCFRTAFVIAGWRRSSWACLLWLRSFKMPGRWRRLPGRACQKHCKQLWQRQRQRQWQWQWQPCGPAAGGASGGWALAGGHEPG